MQPDPLLGHTYARRRGLGFKNLEFFGPQMALAYRLDAISQGPKTLDFQAPPIALVMYLHASKILRTGPY